MRHIFVGSNETANESVDWTLLEASDIRTLVACTLGVIILSTIIGNILALLAVCRISMARSVSHVYIGCLAVSDLLIGLFIMPPMAVVTIYDIQISRQFEWIRQTCNMWQLADAYLCTVSLYTLCGVALDRWMNIERPLRVFTRRRGRAKQAIALAWLVPVVIWAGVYGILAHLQPSSDAVKTGDILDCQALWQAPNVLLVTSIIAFYIPCTGLVVIFIRIAIIVRHHFHFVHKHSQVGRFSTSSLRLTSKPAAPPPATTADQNGGVKVPRRTSSPPPKQQQPKISETQYSLSTSLPRKKNTTNGIGVHTAYDTMASAHRCTSDVQVHVRSPARQRRGLENGDRQSTEEIEADYTSPLPSTTQSRLTMTTTSRHRLIRNSTMMGLVRQDAMCDKNIFPGNASPNRKISTSNTNNGSPTPLERNYRKRLYEKSVCKTATTSYDTVDGGALATQRTNTDSPNRLSWATDADDSVADSSPQRKITGGSLMMRRTNWSQQRTTSIRQSFASIASNLSDVFSSDIGVRVEWRATRTIALVTGVFLMCWTPVLVVLPMRLYAEQSDDNPLSHSLYMLFVWFNYLSAAINPWIYTLFTPRAKRALRTYLPTNIWCAGGWAGAAGAAGTSLAATDGCGGGGAVVVAVCNNNNNHVSLRHKMSGSVV